MSAGIKVEGIFAFTRDSEEVVKELAAEERKIDLVAAEIVAREATRRAPVGDYLSGDNHPGQLARSIRYGAGKGYGFVRISTAYVKPIVFGWKKHGITPNPFPYDALDAKRTEVVALYEARVSQTIDRVFGKGL